MSRLVWLAFCVFVLISIISFLGAYWPPADITSHFRPQLVVTAAIFFILLIGARRVMSALVALVIAGAHLAPVFPYAFPVARASLCPGGTPFRLITLNLHHRHADIGAISSFIRAERPDVMLVTEYVRDHAAALTNLRDVLPYSVKSSRSGIFEVMLLSRYPLSDPVFHRPDPSAPFLPVLQARMCTEDQGERGCVTLIGLHASRPFMGDDGWQTKGFKFAAGLAAGRRDGRVVVAGDLNTTPWASRFRDLVTAGGLRDTALGSSFASTWFSRNPLLGLPIDHILVGRQLAVRDRRIGPDLGSDHYPVIADLAVCRVSGRPATADAG